jgi:hypothetical protein
VHIVVWTVFITRDDASRVMFWFADLFRNGWQSLRVVIPPLSDSHLGTGHPPCSNPGMQVLNGNSQVTHRFRHV